MASGSNPYLEAGPDSWEVSLPVDGGQLVMVDPADTTLQMVKPTDGPVTTCLGQAGIPAVPRAAMGTNFAALRHHTAVRYAPYDVRVTYASSASPGDLLTAASEGRVQKYVPGTHTPDQIIARCTQPGGATSGQRDARARLL